MFMNNSGDFIGLSNSGITEALQNALDQAGNPDHFEVIETRGSKDNQTLTQYQVTLKTYAE